MAATWQKFVANPVRELAPGERPREWTGLELAALATASAPGPARRAFDSVKPALKRVEPALERVESALESLERRKCGIGAGPRSPVSGVTEGRPTTGPPTGAHFFEVGAEVGCTGMGWIRLREPSPVAELDALGELNGAPDSSCGNSAGLGSDGLEEVG